MQKYSATVSVFGRICILSSGTLGEVLMLASWENSTQLINQSCNKKKYQCHAVNDTAGLSLGFPSAGVANMCRNKKASQDFVFCEL